MFRLTKYLERQRTRRILPHLSGSVLDLGCGYNPFVQYLPPGTRYVGVERDEKILRWLELSYPGVPFFRRDLNREPIALDEAFDRIVMMAVIEHLDDPASVLAQLAPLLKPGGRLVITTPTPAGNWVHHHGARLNLFSRLAADEHQVIFTRASLARILDQAGCRMIRHQAFLLGGNQLAIAERRAAR